MADQLPIALIPGIRQDVDRTLLPPGSIIAASGVRLRKNGIAKANGLVNAGVTPHAGSFAGPCDALGFAAGRQIAVMASRAWARESIGETWMEVGRASRARPVKAHWAAFTDVSASGPIQPASAIIGDYTATVYYDGTGVQLAITDPSGIRRATGFYTGRDHPRILALGTTWVLVYRIVGAEIAARTIDGTTLAVSGETTIGSLVAGGDLYDAAAISSTQWVVGRRSATTTFTVALWGVSLGAGPIASQGVTVANNEVTAASLYGTAGENVFATWSQAAATVQQIAAFAPDLTSTIFGSTTFTTSASATPAVMTRRDATSVWVVFEESFATPTRYRLGVRAYDEALGHITAANAFAWHVRAASRPWGGSTTTMNIWLHTDAGTEPWLVQRRYTLATLSMDADVPSSFGMFIEPEIAPDERANQQQSFHIPEVAFRSHTDEAGFSTQRGYLPALATIRTQDDAAVGTPALLLYEWETESGFEGRARRVAEVGGQGVIFGGGLQELPSARINVAGIDTLPRGSENGFLFSPAILSATTTATGADGLTQDALYGFFAVFEYITPDGLRTRSAPSNIAFATPVAGQLNVQLEISTAPTTEREFSSPPNQTVVHIYATIGGGNTYQRITPDNGLAVGIGTTSVGIITYVHSTPDDEVADNEPAYTEAGIANQPAPAHRSGWVGGGYAWAWGLFNPQIIERSKLSVPNEPVQFTRDNTHRCLLPEACTGGGWMDGTNVVFSRSSIYLLPVTLGAPQRLPSSVGCIDSRSIVEVPEGLVFQSRRGIELLPRGFGAPRLISGSIENELRGRRVISATVTGHEGSDFDDAERFGERLLVLVAIAPELSTDPGVRLVLDLDSGRWLSSDPALAASGAIGEYVTTWDGRLVVACRTGTVIRYESPTDWGSVETIPMSITLADARPFGVMGRGRVRRFQVLGEIRTTTKLKPTLYLDGVYSSPADEIDPIEITGEEGDKFLAEWLMPARDLNAVGFKFDFEEPTDTPSEGLVLHALALEGEGLQGRPKVGMERRAA